MATAVQKITLSSSRDIPFNKLVLSQSNVRRVKAGVSIEDLAASIARRGLIQSISVFPVVDAEGVETGMFEVPAGGRRFRALEMLVKQKRLAKIAPVPCVVCERDGAILAEEVSLAENIERAPLHPLDQFRAFQDMRTKGMTEEEIAAAFFVSAQVVKQRLRLASVSPALLDIYAEDGMTLEQLMAFTVSDDHDRQQQVWDAIKETWSKEPYQIRRMLTETTVRATDKRAVFVGLDAYEGAGVSIGTQTGPWIGVQEGPPFDVHGRARVGRCGAVGAAAGNPGASTPSVGGSGAVLEPPAVVAGLDDVAVMRQAIQQRRRHLRVAEHARPLAKGQVRRHQDRGLLVQTADQVEQQLPARLRERQVAKLVEHHEIDAAEMVSEPPLAACTRLRLEPVHQIDHGVEPPARPVADARPRDGDGQMRLARPGAAHQHHVALLREEVPARQVAHQRLVDRRAVEPELLHILRQRQLGQRDLVLDRPRLLFGDLGRDEITDHPLRLVLALHRRTDDLIERRLHSIQFQLTHRGEDLGPLHHALLLRLS